MFGFGNDGVETEGSGLSSFLDVAWAKIPPILTAAFDLVKQAAQTAWELLLGVFGLSADGNETPGAGLGGYLKTAWDAISTLVQTAWDTLLEAIRTAWTSILAVFGLGSDGAETEGGLGGYLKTAWDGISTLVQTAWDTLVESITTAWTGILAVFGLGSDGTEGDGGLGGYLKSAWDGIADLVQSAWDTLQTRITTAWTGILAIFGLTADGVSGEGGLPAMLEAAWTGLPETLGGIWTTVKEHINTAWQQIVNMFFPSSGEEGAGGEGGEEEATGLVAQIQDSWNALDTFFSTLWTDVKAHFQTFWNDILAIFGLSEEGEEQEGQGLHNIIDSVWRPLENTVSEIWTNVKAKIQAAWDAILELLGISESGTGLGTDLATMVDDVWTELETIVETIWTNVESKVQSGWDAILNLLGILPSGVGNGNDLSTLITKVWGTVETAVTNIWTNVTESVRTGWNNIIKILFPDAEGESLASRVLTGWWGIVDSIGAIFTAVVNVVRGTVNLLIDAMNKPLREWNDLTFSVPGFSKSIDTKVFGIKTVGWDGFSIQTPDVPLVPRVELAEGGLVMSPTLALIGEAGPEMVVPLDKLSTQGIGGESTQVVFQGPVYGMDDFQRKVNEALLLANRRGKENLF